jgi:thymidylate synthase (FAD)
MTGENIMKKIETRILNPEALKEAEQMMVCAGRLTQRGHAIKNMDDFISLYNKPYTDKTRQLMVNLPHPTLQKFGVINAVVVGASRRFLAQITRHQNEVKYMSASLQYSDYSGEADFVVPYEILADPEKEASYLHTCAKAMEAYVAGVKGGISNDSAGYMAPQGLRNILIISATPFQWKHMIGQRTCRRNTVETRYVMLRIWEQLYELSPLLFSPETTGMFCVRENCAEGVMSCGRVVAKGLTPGQIIAEDYPLLTAENR